MPALLQLYTDRCRRIAAVMIVVFSVLFQFQIASDYNIQDGLGDHIAGL